MRHPRRVDADGWMAEPPAGAASALAAAPEGRGLLVGRWRAGEPPLLLYVSTADDGGGDDDDEGGGVEGEVAALQSLMVEVKEFDHQEFAADREAGIGPREEYDRRVGALLARVQQSSLRHAALLLAAPVDAAAERRRRRCARGRRNASSAAAVAAAAQSRARAAARARRRRRRPTAGRSGGLLRAACEQRRRSTTDSRRRARRGAPPAWRRRRRRRRCACFASSCAKRGRRTVGRRRRWRAGRAALVVVDERLQALPWESTPLLGSRRAVCRRPNLCRLRRGPRGAQAAAGGVRSDDVLLNPGGDLLRTQDLRTALPHAAVGGRRRRAA